MNDCGLQAVREYASPYHQRDYLEWGYDGVIESGMTLCVESYLGAAGAFQGVKLDEPILVTETGTQLLSDHPVEASLLT